MNKLTLKKALLKVTGCGIQHDGWPCAACFYSISKKLTYKDWQAVLLKRGDYKAENLNNLPKNIDRSLKKILSLCNKKRPYMEQKQSYSYYDCPKCSVALMLDNNRQDDFICPFCDFNIDQWLRDGKVMDI